MSSGFNSGRTLGTVLMITGAALAVGWTPCVGYVLGAELRAADLQAGWEAAGQARVQPLRWRAGLALAELHRAAGRSDDAAAWQRAAQAEIEAVAATFDGPAFRAALLRHALASPLPLPSDPLLPRGEKGQG